MSIACHVYLPATRWFF